MSTSMMLILTVLGVFFAYAILAPVAMNLGRFIGRSWLFCPEHQEYAQVGVHPFAAALSAGYGAPSLSISRCSLLKPGEACDEDCLHGAQF